MSRIGAVRHGEDHLIVNLMKLGVADPEAPSTINIYPVDFESKEQIELIIENYNNISSQK